MPGRRGAGDRDDAADEHQERRTGPRLLRRALGGGVEDAHLAGLVVDQLVAVELEAVL